MKKLLFLILLYCFAAAAVSAQTDKLILRENTPNVETAPKLAKEISVEDWGRLESALLREDWGAAALLSNEYLQKLEIETKNGQLARLRYIYIYSLAGKIIAHSLLGEKTDEVNTRRQLEKATQDLIGKQFVFPVRKILANCQGVVNYVCESKENPGFLRISATNHAGNAIHSFEYIDMNSLVNTTKHDKKDIILGGFLKAVKFNSNEPFKGVMILQFENGFVRNIYTEK